MIREPVITVLLIIFGAIGGMLVNYVADILPWKRRFVKPFCISCEMAQPWNNYFLFPRKCPNCGFRRSWRTWVVELLFIGITLWIWIYPASKIDFLLGWLILVYFGIVVVIDIEHRLIMHPVSLAGAALGLIVGVIRNGWIDTLIGGAIGFGVMWLIYKLGEFILRGLSHFRRQSVNDVALGFGDVNLSGVLGLMLGWPLILWGLMLTAFIGGLISFMYLVFMLILRRYKLFTALPYGPFLIAGAFILLFFGETLLTALGY